MPNMFGRGPLKKALKLLAKEVCEERSVHLTSLGRGAESGWRRSCRVMKGLLGHSGLCPFSPNPSQY